MSSCKRRASSASSSRASSKSKSERDASEIINNYFKKKTNSKSANLNQYAYNKGDNDTKLIIKPRQFENYMINGIQIEFPFKAYPCQINMMEKITRSLNTTNPENAILESPTGSGKSLSILCSVLAWRKHEYQKYTTELSKLKFDENSIQKDEPDILLLENTKEPLQGVVHEPFNTNEKETICLTNNSDDDFQHPTNINMQVSNRSNQNTSDFSDASLMKDPCCIENPEPSNQKLKERTNGKKLKPPGKIYVSSRTHKQITQLIKELRTTTYHPKMAVLGSRSHLCLQPEVLKAPDVNEACKNLTSDGGCGYFNKIDPLVKEIQNDIWDIEDLVEKGRDMKACPYYASRILAQEADTIFAPYNYICDPRKPFHFQLSMSRSLDIRNALNIELKDCVVVLDEAHNIEDAAREVGNFEITNEKIEGIINEIDLLLVNYGKERKRSQEDMSNELVTSYKSQKTLLSLILKWLANSDRQKEFLSEFDSKYFIWEDSEMLNQVLSIGITPATFAEYQKRYNKAVELEASYDQKSSDHFIFLSSGSMNALGGLYGVLEFILESSKKYISDFKLVVIEYIYQSGGSSRKIYKVAFWCLNPGVMFKLIAEKTKSIILTSGTLSPMDTFASELQVDFPIKLEASHIIDKSQIWVGVIPIGPSGMVTSGVFKNLDSFAFQDEIGQAVYSYIKTIPHGVLCFLPSYSFLKKLISRWKSTGLYENMESVKSILIEPQKASGKDFKEILDQFYENIFKSKVEAKRTGNDSGGCLLIAVYRGKISEGLDFIDDNARAVIAVGIPFPNLKDIQVNLKRTYNDKFCLSKGLLSGSQWYEIQAFRATNQALGRCLRHKNDWGAIILLDQRYSISKNCNQLSKWVRQNAVTYPTFNESLTSLSTFMNLWRKAKLEATGIDKILIADDFISIDSGDYFGEKQVETKENMEHFHNKNFNTKKTTTKVDKNKRSNFTSHTLGNDLNNGQLEKRTWPSNKLLQPLQPSEEDIDLLTDSIFTKKDDIYKNKVQVDPLCHPLNEKNTSDPMPSSEYLFLKCVFCATNLGKVPKSHPFLFSYINANIYPSLMPFYKSSFSYLLRPLPTTALAPMIEIENANLEDLFSEPLIMLTKDFVLYDNLKLFGKPRSGFFFKQCKECTNNVDNSTSEKTNIKSCPRISALYRRWNDASFDIVQSLKILTYNPQSKPKIHYEASNESGKTQGQSKNAFGHEYLPGIWLFSLNALSLSVV